MALVQDQIQQLLDDYRAHHAPMVGRFGRELARQLTERAETPAERKRTTEPYPDQELEEYQTALDQELSKS